MGNTLVSVVDDDQSVRDSTDTLLRSAGYEVASFDSGEQFLASSQMSDTACLILDVRMPGMDGLELQDQLNMEPSQIPIIFISGHADGAIQKRAFEGGARAFLQKPFAANDFLGAVESALQRR